MATLVRRLARSHRALEESRVPLPKALVFNYETYSYTFRECSMISRSAVEDKSHRGTRQIIERTNHMPYN